MEQQTKEKERLAKAKEFSRKQRDHVLKKDTKKGTTILDQESQNPAGSHTNFHAQI